MTAQAPGLTQIDALTETQIHDLLDLYRQAWWSAGRELEDVRRMLAHSDLIVGLCDRETHRLVGFARVVTDFVYKALVLDVIVTTTERGKGIGTALLDALIGHPALHSVRHFELYCRPEMVPFYTQWGFSAALDGLQFMRLERGR